MGLLAMPGVARAQTRPGSLHLGYETYAAGLDIAQVEAGFGLGSSAYQVNLAYHTTGVAGFFFRGHQFASVDGVWDGTRPMPRRFIGRGVWRGRDRMSDIAYDKGVPIVRQLIPPDDEAREVVPESLRVNTVDTLSALADLVKTVQATGRCETAVHTYDGRRATEVQAVTVGEETLAPTGRSMFAGQALRCDFSGHMVAGFLQGHDRGHDGRPMHGSAWLAPVVAGGPPVPVRLSFETNWFGELTMYLTSAGTGMDAAAEAEP